jgi:hypothetical protein
MCECNKNRWVTIECTREKILKGFLVPIYVITGLISNEWLHSFFFMGGKVVLSLHATPPPNGYL